MSIRWTPQRKLALLHAIATGELTRREAMIYHGLSTAELDEWQHAFNVHGLPGLRTTHLQERRRPRPKKHTPIIQ
jgi:hypothetical protein